MARLRRCVRSVNYHLQPAPRVEIAHIAAAQQDGRGVGFHDGWPTNALACPEREKVEHRYLGPAAKIDLASRLWTDLGPRNIWNYALHLRQPADHRQARVHQDGLLVSQRIGVETFVRGVEPVGEIRRQGRRGPINIVQTYGDFENLFAVTHVRRTVQRHLTVEPGQPRSALFLHRRERRLQGSGVEAGRLCLTAA